MNEVTMYLVMAAFLVWGITSFVVIVDMLKQNTALGCLGFILFPIVPLIWVVTRYSGRRKVVAPLLFTAAIIGFGGMALHLKLSNTALAPFMETAKADKGLDCNLVNVGFSDGETRYIVACTEDSPLPEDYVNVESMVQTYSQEFAVPLAQTYNSKVNEEERFNLILAIYTPSGFAVCNKVSPDGELLESWHSGTEDLCE